MICAPTIRSIAALLRENDKKAAYNTDRDSGYWVEKLIAYAKQSWRSYAIWMDGSPVASDP